MQLVNLYPDLTYKLVPEPDPVGQPRRGDDEAVDEGHQRRLVVRRGGMPQLLDYHGEAVPLALQCLGRRQIFIVF